jgi:hypothetical protein
MSTLAQTQRTTNYPTIGSTKLATSLLSNQYSFQTSLQYSYLTTIIAPIKFQSFGTRIFNN